MAKKRNIDVPPDRELDRLTRKLDRLHTKVSANEFMSEMSGSRLANVKLRYQIPKLEKVKIDRLNRLNTLLNGRTVDAGTKSSLDSLRKVINSPMRGEGGGGPNIGRGQGGRSGGGGILKPGK